MCYENYGRSLTDHTTTTATKQTKIEKARAVSKTKTRNSKGHFVKATA